MITHPGGPINSSAADIITREVRPATRSPSGIGHVRGRANRDLRLDDVRKRALAGERLTLADGELLYTTPDLWAVFEMADAVRRKLHPTAGYYNVNRHMNYSNVCALSCTFCEFHRKQGQDGAYTRDLDYVREQTRSAVESGATEMHVVGGLHPYLPWSYYPALVATIRDEAAKLGSALHVKAFTAVEIVHLAKIAKRYTASDRTAGIRWVLEQLKDAGLGSLPGGGAEVFDDRVHDEAFKGKIRSDIWLDVHQIAHELGLNTNATILYGHVEDRRERLVHMDMLRKAQDEALSRLGYDADAHGAVTLTRQGVEMPTPAMNERGGYFQTITPLPFVPDGSVLERLPGPSGLENLRTLAIARLMLDNFLHVKAFWIMQTLNAAQLMLQCGADDLDGTVVWYDITKVGGASTHQEVTVRDLQRAIREAGFEPIERDTLYRPVMREGTRWWVGK